MRPQIGMRVKLAARGGGPLAVVGRLPLEVRPDGHRDPARPRGAEGARHGGLLPAAALPPRQPDHQHPHRQGRAERGGARLRRAGQARAPGCEYLDVGGGLGVDYDGSQTNFESSVNYTLQEYANDVVYHIQTVCDEAGCRIRRSSPRAAAPSSRTTACWSSTCSASSGFGDEKMPDDRRRTMRAAARRPDRDLPRASPRGTCSRAITTRSRRSTWR